MEHQVRTEKTGQTGQKTAAEAGRAPEYEIAALLAKKKLRVTTAESCTGGLIAGTLVNVPGISAWFEEGYVTYSNGAKERLLGVPHAVLEAHGAVSEETAKAMAEGAARAAHADAAIISTGIAGPDGGTKEKPVGLVYIGCYCRGKTRVEKHLFQGDRGAVRGQSVQAALLLLKTMLAGEKSGE